MSQTINQQGFPKLDSKIVNPDGTLDWVWYRFLISLWQRSGGASPGPTPPQVTVTLQLNGGLLQAFEFPSGQLIGTLDILGLAGQTGEIQQPEISPWSFSSSSAGTLVVYSGKVEVSRNGEAFTPLGLCGGAVPIRAFDSARVTWFGPDAPTVVWLPT